MSTLVDRLAGRQVNKYGLPICNFVGMLITTNALLPMGNEFDDFNGIPIQATHTIVPNMLYWGHPHSSNELSTNPFCAGVLVKSQSINSPGDE